MKMSDKKIILSILGFTLLVVIGGVFMISKSEGPGKVVASQNAQVVADEKSFDWGEIKYDGPKAAKTFRIRNNGTEVLKLTNVKTSCACTSAQIKSKSEVSPYFNMHSVSSWVGEIPPGEEAELEVVFDQRFHGPTGVGPINRIITIETNDEKNRKIEFNLIGNVIK